MKIIEWAIVGVLIFLPFATVNRIEVETQRKALLTELRYNAALNAAVDDAARTLTVNANQQRETQYESAKRVALNKDEAIAAFYRTLYTNFGIADDPIAQGVLNRYIPAVVVIGYDGFYIYAEDEWTGTDGNTERKPVWGAKKPYAYADLSGNSLSFTLDDFVLAYDAGSRSWHEGLRVDVRQQTNIALLKDAERFEQVRRSTIVRAIEDELAYRINKHNESVSRFGLSYTFTLPTISQEEWHNTVDDVGVLAFIQGIPMGGKFYNNYALGGSRVLKKPEIVGARKGSMKVYYHTTCGFSYPVEETFSSEKAAALKGYMPLGCPPAPS
ncbi:hypothetical protein P9314_02900 [Paenibacillus validus]|uniref:hypothetical protein n=1 Tax=Paenibacillus TaxID=44249 RepID=UPI000FD77A5C|nr:MULTISPECIES: hypothetical protein [Paenibacillus]MED4599652.1 hypothetical protein [Paenibacillus validus]MED4604584.1 hypothetical protein [Paenibacillus validus]NTZ19117.1 hypothetical protein [Paenibacillus sp. JMULE4]